MEVWKTIASPALLLVVVLLVTLYVLRKLFFDDGGKVGNFHEKFVLITGCDSGFGKMAALRLDHLGFRVIAACFTSEGEKALAGEGSDHMITFRLDVTKTEQVKEVYSKVKALIPSDRGLWCIVNNAGIAQVGPVDWVTLDRFKYSADVNLWGMIDVTKTFLPLVKKAKGRVVNLVSIAGRISLPNCVAYSISKYGAEAFSDALRREMSVFGVQVSIIEPGFFKTPMTSRETMTKAWSDLWNSLDKEKQQEYGEECYQTYVDNTMTGMVDTLVSPHCYKVIDGITHAVTSNRPKTRYLIGWDVYLLWLWLSWLPTSVGDVIVEMMAKKPTIPQSVRRQ